MIYTLADVSIASQLISKESPELGAHIYLNNDDAKLKYAFILDEASELNLDRKSRILEVGAGDGHISRLLARKYGCKIDAVDISRRRYVLDRPPRPIGIPRRMLGNFKRWLGSVAKVNYIVNDCSQYLSLKGSESYDLIIDGCSVIHFHETLVSKQEEYSDFLTRDYSNIFRILKKGGAFITATDVSLDSSSPHDEIFYLGHLELKEKLTAVGFELAELDGALTKDLPTERPYSQVLEWPYLRVVMDSRKEPYVLGVAGITAHKV